jgi:hypothetical protein
MTTNKLRRDLEALRMRSGRGDCSGCGYPTYSHVETRVVVNIRGVDDPPPPPRDPDPCEVCGREKKHDVIRMRGLEEKARGYRDD